MPPVVSQFFYSTLIPIDELLATSARSGSSNNKSPKRQFRPFGQGDNITLEKAWMSLASDNFRADHHAARATKCETASTSNRREQRRQRLVETLALKHVKLHNNLTNEQHYSRDAGRPEVAGELPVCCQSLRSEVAEILQQTFCALSRKTRPDLTINAVEQDVIGSMGNSSNGNVNKYETTNDWPATQTQAAKGPADDQRNPRSNSAVTTGSTQTGTPTDVHVSVRLPATSVGISGKPFIRVGNEDTFNSPNALTASHVKMVDPSSGDDALRTPEVMPGSKSAHACVSSESDQSILDVVVGVSRLHKVSLPTLVMKPIYWSPVNDAAVVMRATWFYRYVFT